MNDWICSPVYPTEADNGHLLIHSVSSFYYILLRFCVLTGMSVDYFTLQDYSQWAELDGKALTPQQQMWLSKYLCADLATQERAIFRFAVC